jgi:DNA-directed RNA polymerase alpha subunit
MMKIRSDKPITKLGLSKRACAGLLRNNITRYGDLCRRSEVDLLRLRGIGRGVILELRSMFAARGSYLGKAEGIAVQNPLNDLERLL